MLTEIQRQYIAAATRTMQIIVGVLATGVFIFLGVVLNLPVQPPAGPLVNTYVALGAAAVAIVAAVAVPAIMAQKMVAAGGSGKVPNPAPQIPDAADADELADVGPLVAIYQTTLIVGVAILEGAAFYNAITFMLERQTINLVAAAVLAAFVIAKLPTPSRVEDWVLNQLATLRQMREMRGGDAR
jgi:hypothetical protein